MPFPVCVYGRGLVAAFLTLITVVTVSSAADAGPSQPPNIVLIVADDLGWNDVPWHNSLVRAPTLARLAADGVTLEQAYVQPICTPSRSALLTGRYPFTLGRQHDVLWPLQPTGLTLDTPLLSEKLRSAGYRAHAVGKWHLGFCRRAYTPTERGFQSFLGFWTGSENYYTHWRGLDEGGSGLDFRRNMSVAREFEGRYSSEVFAAEAERVIETHPADRPLFLYLAFQSVHAPLQVPRRYWDLYPGVRDKSRRTFLGMVSALDDAVQRVESALRAAGLYDNTVIIFTADNGGQVLAGGNNYPLRGNKVTLWEGGTRAASFVHSPLLERPRRASRALIHVTDWFPTVLRLAGAPQPTPEDRLDGVDQWDAISRGEPSTRSEVVYNIDVEKKPGAAIRVGDFKLIWGYPGSKNDWYPEPGITELWPLVPTELAPARYTEVGEHRWSGSNTTWLFDLASDPTEHVNLAAQRPALVAELKHRLLRHRRRLVPADCPPDDPRGSPDNFGHVFATGWCEPGVPAKTQLDSFYNFLV
ncbi:arylsulfatase I-like [Amphibalanus amphitrite]|uniref:arylsulfatase I-like n=1 Tax=Amphibalanus amphitrite TaxID=1232801 RepID=UPI001C918E69|nr:arylsulfatase I-like [Amphibalanus amphitrite]